MFGSKIGYHTRHRDPFIYILFSRIVTLHEWYGSHVVIRYNVLLMIILCSTRKRVRKIIFLRIVWQEAFLAMTIGLLNNVISQFYTGKKCRLWPTNAVVELSLEQHFYLLYIFFVQLYGYISSKILI